MAAVDSFEWCVFKVEFLQESYHSECPARLFWKAKKISFHVGSVLLILPRWVLDPNFRVLGDGLAVLSLSSPNRVVNGRVGRPKYDIKEETLIELRSLGFSWEDIARMLVVSRWTIHRRISEFGLNHLPRFSDVTDEQLDSKVSAFLREHGCLVGSSMVLGHLRS